MKHETSIFCKDCTHTLNVLEDIPVNMERQISREKTYREDSFLSDQVSSWYLPKKGRLLGFNPANIFPQEVRKCCKIQRMIKKLICEISSNYSVIKLPFFIVDSCTVKLTIDNFPVTRESAFVYNNSPIPTKLNQGTQILLKEK